MSPFGPVHYLHQDNLLWVRPAISPSTATISAADGTWVGTPHHPLVYTAHNVTARYAGGPTQFRLLLDAGSGVGNGTQVRVSYDLTGDGSFDRVETYHYFATDPVVDTWESYTEARGLSSATGTLGDLANGTVRVEVWNAIGGAATRIGVGNQSTVTLPYTG
ncbi:hypothetical protein GSF22_17045 [Micromonospora echinofusca]|uniref:Uncharacterized protein n=1 Tax=Micromonospora echinofusca TaxID=47858 RepID=A0ABS3VT33_MICEH|nr:hypothetical protein [Micromonospora echinofusca]